MNTLSSVISSLVTRKQGLQEALSGQLSFYVRRDRENELYLTNSLLQAVDKLVEREDFLSPGDIRWEFDGGDPTVSVYLTLSAVNTAYFSLFYAWKRENHKEPVCSEFVEFPDEVEELPSFEDAVMAASAAVRYLVHLSRFPGLGWAVRYIQSYKDWVTARISQVSPEEALLLRQSVEDVSLENLSIDDAKQFFNLWLHEPSSNGITADRHERIVSRVADAQADKFLGLAASGDFDSLRRASKKLELWELILASDYLKRLVQGYKASADYEERVRIKRLEEIEAKVQYFSEQQARAERFAALARREEELLSKLDSLFKKSSSNPTLASQVESFLKKYSAH